jgi:D-glycero-D-manno-heptose 1,7-bisphosphate phosphatase
MTKIPPQNRPAVFMDRDGTMTVEGGYINHPSRLQLISGTADAVRLLNEQEVLAIVTTNQAGVARGYFTEDLIHVVHEKMKVMLGEHGARLDGVYYCPHHPREGTPDYRKACDCRKPRPGMIQQACRDLPIDLTRSYMVGDKISDSEFGHGLGVKTVMVLTGYGLGEYEYQRQDWKDQPDHIARNLHEAVQWILEDLGRPKAEDK